MTTGKYGGNMRVRHSQFRRLLSVRTSVLLAFAILVLAGLAFFQRRSPVLASSLCVSVALVATFSARSRMGVLFHSASANTRDLALARSMAAASRQPFFFCCPARNGEGALTGLTIRFVNTAACRALGSSRRLLRGADFLEALGARDADQELRR